MKMKFVFLGATALVLSAAASAQSGTQIKAGLNLANVSVTNDGRVEDANQLTTFHIGLVGDVPLGSIFYFQPGLLFTGKGAKTQSGDATTNNYSKATTNPFYLEVPANFVIKAPISGGTKLFVGAGPYLAAGISGKTKIENVRPILGSSKVERNIEFSDDDPTTLDYEEGAGFGILRRFDYGFNGMAGIEGRNMVLGVNYGLGMAKLQSGANNNENNNNKHRVFSISLGFKL